MNPTNNQLAQTFDVSARQISKARRDKKRLVNPATLKSQKMPPVHIQETSHRRHRGNRSSDDRSLTGRTIKDKG